MTSMLIDNYQVYHAMMLMGATPGDVSVLVSQPHHNHTSLVCHGSIRYLHPHSSQEMFSGIGNCIGQHQLKQQK